MHRLKSMEPRSRFLLAGLALSGFCISLLACHVYFIKKKKKELKVFQSTDGDAIDKKKLELDVTLDQGHLDWIEQCAQEFGLPSVDKAIRILLTYAQHVADEMLIFEQVRCNFCKDKQKVAKKYTIDLAHDQYLDDMVSKHKLASKDKALRIIVDYAISSDEKATIFGVKRCSHGDTCKNC
eukprot:c1958_g1_i1 orf=216-758(-)